MRGRPEDAGWMEYPLNAGRLLLRSSGSQENELFRVAERINPKRAFLFVSTVLGRHIPVDPKVHRAALRALAQRISMNILEGPCFVIGYAETAIGLGAGVFQELRNLNPDRAIGYLPTTRFEPSREDVWFRIEEPHSHASDHAVLVPKAGVLHDGAGSSLILVDDETTTGTTFCNLAAKLHEVGARFDRVVLVSLTDWSEGAAVSRVASAVPDTDVVAVSLFEGAWRWLSDDAYPGPELPAAKRPQSPVWRPSGKAVLEVPRFGIAHGDQPMMSARVAAGIASAAGLDALPSDGRILVLGTGEHVWEPFLFAEAVSTTHPNTRFVATTRSPVMLGDTIRCKIEFGDHYGSGFAMYLHNVVPEDWDVIILFNETGIAGVPAELIGALGAVFVVDQTAQLEQRIATEAGVVT